MHAMNIIQNLLDTQCPAIHVKRRRSLAAMARAASGSKLTLMEISRHLDSNTTIRHKIKQCDRLLSNSKLQGEAGVIYAALCQSILQQIKQPVIIVDWSDLVADRSWQLLRASLAAQGRALTLYEEVHPVTDFASPQVQHHFMAQLTSILPVGCVPVIVTDAGFRAPWFKLLNEFGLPWLGRIRNTDMVRAAASHQDWQGCKNLYQFAENFPKDLGAWDYVRSNSVRCRLVMFKKQPVGRHAKTVFGNPARNARSLKLAKGQTEPWLLAMSPSLAHLTAAQAVEIYGSRMQIEQSFRDTKNPRWGLGLSESQTKKPHRLAVLLLIGALATYALWIIGLALQQRGEDMHYGSSKAGQTLSIPSLAHRSLVQTPTLRFGREQIRQAFDRLRSIILQAYF